VRNKPTGIDVISSDENTYSGNTLSENDNDMHFNGNNRGVTGSIIQWNQFDFSSGSSLVYDPAAFTGRQHENNTNYNSWISQGNQGGGNVEVQHASPPFSFSVLQSRFRRPFNAAVGSEHFPNRNPSGPGGMMFPALTSTITPIPLPLCNPTTGCFVMLAPPDPGPEVDYAAIVQDAATWSTLTAAQQTFLHQGIYGHLLDNPTWLNGSSTLSNFKAAQDATFVGQSETLRKAWLQLMSDIEAHQATLEPTYAALDVLSNQLQQWFDAIASDPSLEASLQSQINAAIQQGDALEAQLQQAENQFAPTVQAVVTQLLVQNASLDGTMPHTWNEKRYNQIAINWLVGTEPDATAANDLRQMAQSCLSDGGRAVLAARGLCATWLKEYYDEDNCNNFQGGGGTGRDASAGTTPSPVMLRVVPNPADDMVWIGLDSDATEGQDIQVFSTDGQIVFSGKLPTKGSLAIPVEGWPTGLYIAKIKGAQATITHSFVVQHP
jgi:Secretion system C-terminal sorting domain